jgi:hypothetical protein
VIENTGSILGQASLISSQAKLEIAPIVVHYNIRPYLRAVATWSPSEKELEALGEERLKE